MSSLHVQLNKRYTAWKLRMPVTRAFLDKKTAFYQGSASNCHDYVWNSLFTLTRASNTLFNDPALYFLFPVLMWHIVIYRRAYNISQITISYRDWCYYFPINSRLLYQVLHQQRDFLLCPDGLSFSLLCRGSRDRLQQLGFAAGGAVLQEHHDAGRDGAQELRGHVVVRRIRDDMMPIWVLLVKTSWFEFVCFVSWKKQVIPLVIPVIPIIMT